MSFLNDIMRAKGPDDGDDTDNAKFGMKPVQNDTITSANTEPTSVGVGKATHSRHDSQNIVVNCVHPDLGGLVAADSVGRDHELERGVVDP